MARTKPKPPLTNTERQLTHLVRLSEQNGKRLPVDLKGEHVAIIDDLIAVNYENSAVGVIRKALVEAHQRINKK